MYIYKIETIFPVTEVITDDTATYPGDVSSRTRRPRRTAPLTMGIGHRGRLNSRMVHPGQHTPPFCLITPK